ncbi:uncharacterized protein LOC125434273 isoform X2 [Sphaerodactylus townsendi]|nr:uncharacterized protein LOC125434273 isoform X2 [Sphaerodactylus townsendi]
MARLSPQSTTFPLTANIHEQKVIFVICASERMPSKTTILKELLIKTLFSLISRPRDCMFSIICCATANKVLKWQNTLGKCSLASVAEAAAWIRALECVSGASVVSGVEAALEDPSCQAVYLFTGGLPECTAEEICLLLKKTGRVRPLHTVYLLGNGGENKNRFQEILEKIAKESGGSFQRISFSPEECEDQINPGGMTSIHHPDCIGWSSLPASHHTAKCSPLGIWSLDSPHTPLFNSTKEDFIACHPMIDSLQRGVRVLARKKTDGYFYLGHIAQHVKGSKGHVLIMFKRARKSPKGKAEFRMQETPLYDVIHHEDGRWQPVAPGDRVLAPWEKKGNRYGPGTVLQITETGLAHSAFKNSEVLVSFWNGKTKKVPMDIVVRIPLPVSERIILELQMPLAARQMLVEQNPHYPYTVPPGYRASGPCRQSRLDCICWRDVSKGPHVSTTCCSAQVPPWCFCSPAWEHVWPTVTSMQPEDTLIPGTNMTKEELNRKIEEQLSRGKLPVWKTSEKSGKLKEKKNVVDVTAHKESESEVTTQTRQKESASEDLPEEDLREGTSTTVDIAVNTDKCVPWQEQKVYPQPNVTETSAQPFYQSPRVAPLPQVHAIIGWADQSLKEDSSAIESVLPMRRSHSAPAVQRLTVKTASPDSAREAVRIEFRRQKREQRQLKEEQERQEERIRKDLLRDKKRHRSLQQSLQGSQKQQENSERAWQHFRQLQVATAERRRQESCLREEEENKESQRLEFLKAQRKHRDQQLAEHNQRVADQESKRLELLKNRMQSVKKNLEAAGQEEGAKEKETVTAKLRDLQKRELMSQRVEKKRQETQDLQRYVREQSLLMLRASLLS